MSHLNEQWYQVTDWSIVEDDWKRANERTGDPIEPEFSADVLKLKEFAFELLIRLTDDYGYREDGSFTCAIRDANTPEQMYPIINQLQGHFLTAMKADAGF